ncbi:DNA-3-methyladenine glycosylase family protein [Microbacterium azadirachtae]|uniref:3-methyl-adenine DNA glycosylase II n=1 Tax=Microbacterium azadirachtae TaxID=582680 RepID=A0A0F0KH30_9MICO|nr:DNA-3-methyladenine glycosylase [Microbacterium azadirachtae]KJL19455.1 3-methyl-adenine DNA glycosylase II [Microbacterium azadirachtae]SDL43148.1 DNA-3-methyladenine glycosylase II [Microbacterium azadirachtae]SEF73642.1 DNA-3-methyladenine glycosylase II [Microbacterium azadirachtae]SEF74273.1 DNA-3-methyladenine glycosylase II [Microbacterium azadirachtae]
MSTATRTISLPLVGPYDLREVALMGFGHRDEAAFDGVMRLAFCTDALDAQVGVEVRQHDGALALTVHGEGDPTAIAAQVARVVSADHDGEAWAAVCAADPVLARVHAAAPGFRPSNFYSPYEAAVWAVLSARRARRQGIALRQRLSQQHGAVFEVAGRTEAALPLPEQLLGVDAFPGLPADRIPRLHAIARAALDGRLDVRRLAAMPPADAMLDVQQLPGIGPFYSALIVIRSCGLTDVLSTQEDHTRAAVQALYGLDHAPDDAELARIAEGWRPFRTWAAVSLRAVGSRLIAQSDA